jgi:hypothetical protein
MAHDPIKYSEKFLGQRLMSFEVEADGDNGGVLVMRFENGFIEFTGEDFEIYMELMESH